MIKHRNAKLGTVAVALAAANLFGQSNFKNLNPVFPGPGINANTNNVGAPGLSGGVIIGGVTNWPATNGLNQGAPPSGYRVDSGEGKSTEPGSGPAQAPGPGTAPGVGDAPRVGEAPLIGSAPSVGNSPSLGTPPKIR